MLFRPGFLLLATAVTASAAEPAWQPVRPVMEKYCYECHGGKKTKGGIDLKKLSENPDVAGNFELWEKVAEAIDAGDMPPEDDPQPATAEKDVVVKWLGHSLDAAAHANAGDPGLVTLRRLTNAEYDNTIRHLTGVDFAFGKEFLPDGGGGEGFSNIGDVLFVSPQQLDKYLGAARKLTEHAAILPGRGILFQPQRVGLRSPVQLRQQAEQALYIWYQKMAAPHLPKDDEDRRMDEYMIAAWKHKHREITGAHSLDQLAKDNKLSAAFLHNWWELLNGKTPTSRFLDLMRLPWQALPGPSPEKPNEVPADVVENIRTIEKNQLAWNLPPGSPGWIRTQRRQQDTDAIRPASIRNRILEGQPLHLVAGDVGDGNKGDLIIFQSIVIERDDKKKENYHDWLKRRIEVNQKRIQEIEANPATDQSPVGSLKKWNDQGRQALSLFGKHPLGMEIDPRSIAIQAPAIVTLPFGENSVFHVTAQIETKHPEFDLSSVQWTFTGETPPDPSKLIPGPLLIYKRQTPVQRTLMGEFSQMKFALPDEYNRLLEEVSRNYRRRDGKGTGIYFLSDEQLRATLDDEGRRTHDRMLKDWRILSAPKPDKKIPKEWDESLLGHLNWFAAKAWRRPLLSEEKDHFAKIYADSRSRELDQESAAREVLMRVFIAPDFIFKLEKVDTPGIQPVNAWELATRLSYFLWSAPPDNELRIAADDGSLLKPEVLAAQTKRMLASKNSEAFAEEFAGQWLKFHGFSKHSTVDAGKFPEFTPELRADMHHETREFFTYLIREDRPVNEILLADYTFLNERLAKHYGIPEVTGPDFRKVNVAKNHRGGILGMGSILTKTSFPQRTSPVLRGDWLLHAVLGMPTPPPPADVPPFPEATDKPMTVRERLEAHRAEKACASCHDKIDPLGFALEGFDAIGRFREKDEAGLAIDDTGSLKDGTKFEGIDGLRSYLSTRDKEFNQLLARKLVGYSLGRSVMPSDKVLIAEISTALEKSGGKFSSAILTVVQSPQFKTRRNE